MNFKFALGVLGVVLTSFVASAAPSISSFTPNYGWSNSVAVPGNIITINGSGLYPGPGGTLVVKFNGITATNYLATLVDGTEIQAQIRIGTPSGTGPVVVIVNGVQAPTNNGIYFTVIGPNDPYVTGFSPATAPASGGTSVTISGVHFFNSSPVTAIKFNGVSASGTINGDDLITATVPAGATTGPIIVEKTGATKFVSATNFYVAPTITSFSPSSGRAGSNVVIRGTSFTNASVVKFGSLNAASFTVDSNSQITAVAPNGVLTGTITVTAPAGTFITSTNFKVVPNVSGFTPGFGSVGNNVTVNGANFTGTTSVKFGGVSANFSGVSFGSLTAMIPAGATNAPISVTTGDGTGTSAQNFYVAAAITSFTPTNSAPGTTVQLTGVNFSDATAVKFNGQSASFDITNNTTIGAVVPANVSTGPLSVTTPAGTVNSIGLFYGSPVINNFNPTHGAPGTSVAIAGTNFLGTTRVLFNGTNASFTVNNNGSITAAVPTNTQSGSITVIAPGGTNSLGTFTLDLTSDLNVGVADAPDPVFVGSNLVYTITVANSGPDAALNVRLTNTLPASVSLKSAAASQGTLNTNANPVIASLGTINNAGLATVILTVVPQGLGSITNLAAVGGDNTEPTPVNNLATTATTVWPLPFLGIQTLTSNQIKVFWPAPLSNFYLLEKSNLRAATWNTNLTARVISGTNISVTEINSNAAKFFRLKQ